METNYVAVFAAAIAGWLLGAAWYGVLGKQWMTALGWDEAKINGPRQIPVVAMIISFIALLIMAYLLAGIMAHMGPASVRIGAISGALVWLGFSITTMSVNNAFQMRNPMLTIIDGGHWLAVLVLQGAVIGFLG
jgi:hypothetical protein